MKAKSADRVATREAKSDAVVVSPTTIKESASQIWLAGLGALGRARAEGGKIFEALVEEGRVLKSKTLKRGAITGRRHGRHSDRHQALAADVAAVLSSQDERKLEELEGFVAHLRADELEQQIQRFRGMSFFNDEALTEQARLHTRLQNRIRERFKLFTQSTLGEKLGHGKGKHARQKVNRWINSGKLFTVKDGQALVPEFLIDWENRQPHPLVEKTIDSFPADTSGWTMAYWMCQPNDYLHGLEPVEIMDSDPAEYLLALEARTRGGHN